MDRIEAIMLRPLDIITLGGVMWVTVCDVTLNPADYSKVTITTDDGSHVVRADRKILVKL